MKKRLSCARVFTAGMATALSACSSSTPQSDASLAQAGTADTRIIVAVNVDACGTSTNATRVSLAEWSDARDRLLVTAQAFVDSLKGAERHTASEPARSIFRLAAYRPQATPSQGRGTHAGRGQAADDAATHNIVRDTSHKLSVKMRTTLLSNRIGGKPGMSQTDACKGAAAPEVQDAQRLVEVDGFGPVAQIVTMPGMDLRTYADYADYKLAALIEVTPDQGMTSEQYHALNRYAALHLELTINCVFLRRVGNAWDARVLPQTDAGLCDQTNAMNAAKLDVESSPPNSAETSPPTSRFVEAEDMSPLISVRCALEWCVLGPPGVHAAKPIHLRPVQPGGLMPMDMPHAPPRSPQSKLGLWSDEQHLAVIAVPGAKPVAGFLASVVPDTGLRNRTTGNYADGWILGAYVYASAEPPPSYAKKFGYSKGWNRVYLRHEGDIWMSLVLDSNYGIHVRPVTIYPHTLGDTPGTARWAWVDSDEWIWIPCADGCCLVENGKDS